MLFRHLHTIKRIFRFSVSDLFQKRPSWRGRAVAGPFCLPKKKGKKLRFPLPRTFFMRIPVVSHIFHEDSRCPAYFSLSFPLTRTFSIRIPVDPHIFHEDSRCPAHFSLGFPLTRTFFIRMPVVPHIFPSPAGRGSTTWQTLIPTTGRGSENN